MSGNIDPHTTSPEDWAALLREERADRAIEHAQLYGRHTGEPLDLQTVAPSDTPIPNAEAEPSSTDTSSAQPSAPRPLDLLPPAEPDWRLDDETKEIGKRGLAKARAALAEARLRSTRSDDKSPPV